jgi:hypothetical protein
LIQGSGVSGRVITYSRAASSKRPNVVMTAAQHVRRHHNFRCKP